MRRAEGRRARRPAALAAAILIAMLAATGVATVLSLDALDDRERSRVRGGAQDAVRSIDRRVRAYTETLYGVRGLFTASGTVTRAGYHRHITSLALARRYPGIQVIGVAELVAGRDRDRFVAGVRADTRASGLPYPPFAIHPAGRRPRSLVIDYVEPQHGNDQAFGLDLFAEADRRASALRTAATGLPSASAPVRLVQEVGAQRGFLFQLAYYRGGAPLRTAMERRAALRGTVSAAFRMGDLMRGVLGPRARGYDVEIYDVGTVAGPAAAPGAANRIYDLDGRASDPARIADPERATTVSLTVGGREWRVRYALGASPLSTTERRVPLAIALGGTLIGVLLTWLVHALASARVVAERTSAAKSAFLATMSHELRTPLVGVTGTLDVLARTELDADQASMVGLSRRSADSLLHVIGDLLDLSKIEAGKLALEPRVTSLRRVVGAVVAQFRPTALSRGIGLGLEIDARVADAHRCDPLRLQQILANLVSNALKFTPEGSVDVSLRVLEDDGERQRLEFTVCDTGIGVSGADQRRLFQPFEQATSHARATESGTGLGLSICRQLAGLMDADLTMESEPERGTTMRLALWLPVGDAAEIDPTLEQRPAAPVSRRVSTPEEAERDGSLVLLVEDHDVTRRVVVRQLESIGFLADTAADGEEALTLFRGRSYGLVLTDLSLPRLGGLDLAAAIRRLERETDRPRTPVLALTGGVVGDELAGCGAEGIDDVVIKPAATSLLAAKLREWLPHLTWAEGNPVAGDGAAAATDGAIDAAVLADLTGGDASLAETVLADFVGASREDLAALRRAVDAGQADAVRLHAHRVGGASRVVGAHEVAAIAQEIERIALGRMDGVAGYAEQLDAALERVAESESAMTRRRAAGQTSER